MKTSYAHKAFLTMALGAIFLVIAAVPLRSTAGTLSVATSVNIVNNSSRAINHVYLSSVNADDWSADQLSSPVGAGYSVTLNNLSCSNGQVKVIGEDADGCFVNIVVTCDQSPTWTVTDSTARDCGN